MGQKKHIMDQKGLKMHKKKAKNGVFGPKYIVFDGFPKGSFQKQEGGGCTPQFREGKNLLKTAIFGQKMPFLTHFFINCF